MSPAGRWGLFCNTKTTEYIYPEEMTTRQHREYRAKTQMIYFAVSDVWSLCIAVVAWCRFLYSTFFCVRWVFFAVCWFRYFRKKIKTEILGCCQHATDSVWWWEWTRPFHFLAFFFYFTANVETIFVTRGTNYKISFHGDRIEGGQRRSLHGYQETSLCAGLGTSTTVKTDFESSSSSKKSKHKS